MSQRFAMPYAEWINGSSVVQAGAKLYFYASGTTTPQNTYSDNALSVANTNPVIADSAGRFGDIFLQGLDYKVVLTTSADVTIWTADPITASSAADGVKWRPSVRVATTANITLSGTQTIDGIAVVAGDRVLVKDQSSAKDNGIYVCAAGAWTRASDADTWTELVALCVAVEVGTVNADFTFICTVDQGGTLGVTSVTWSTFKITLADGSVTTAKIANLAVTTALLNDLAVTTAKIADANVTAAKLASTAVTPGAYTSANITVDQQGRITAAASGAAASSGVTWLNTQTAATSAALTFASLISSTYNKYLLEFDDLIFSAASGDLLLEVSTDNGATWKTTTYLNNMVSLSSGGPTFTASTIGILLASVATASAVPLSGEVTFSNPNSTANVCWFGGGVRMLIAGPTLVPILPAGYYNVTGTAINAVRLRPSTGTFTSGAARLYGYQKS